MTVTVILSAIIIAGLLAAILINHRTTLRLRNEKHDLETRLSTEEARWQSETKNLSQRLDETRQEHQQHTADLTRDYTARLDRQKEESEKTIQSAKTDAERTLQMTKDDDAKALANYKEEARRRHEQVLDETRRVSTMSASSKAARAPASSPPTTSTPPSTCPTMRRLPLSPTRNRYRPCRRTRQTA